MEKQLVKKQLMVTSLLIMMIAVLTIFHDSTVFGADSNITVEINGQSVVFNDQQPIIKDGRTLVPVRGVFEQLGYSVSWEQSSNTAILSNDSNTVLITVGCYTFTTNGKTYSLDVPAQIINSRTMLPLRAVLESVGCSVDWDSDRNAVIVSSNTQIEEDNIRIEVTVELLSNRADIQNYSFVGTHSYNYRPDSRYSGVQYYPIAIEGAYISALPVSEEILYELFIDSGMDADLISEVGGRTISEFALYGFVDIDGSIISEPVWNSVRSFSDGMALVNRWGKWGYINKNGEVIIEPSYDYAGDFVDGVAFVANEATDERMFIDKDGNILRQTPQSDLFQTDDSASNLVMSLPIEYQMSLISTMAYRTIGYFSMYDSLLNYSEGLLMFESEETGKLGYVDISGKVIIEPVWDSAKPFRNGTAPVKLNDKWGIINKTGEVIFKPQWDRAPETFLNDLYITASKEGDNHKYGIINNTGDIISRGYWTAIPFIVYSPAAMSGDTNYRMYTDAAVNEGLILIINDDRKLGFIDKTSNIIVEPIWDYITPYIDGFTFALNPKLNQYAIINITGKVKELNIANIGAEIVANDMLSLYNNVLDGSASMKDILLYFGNDDN